MNSNRLKVYYVMTISNKKTDKALPYQETSKSISDVHVSEGLLP
jgi:hypothetical protein